MEIDTHLVWIDLEMTGLDVERDTIVEIATIITDAQLTILEEGPSLVIHQEESQLNVMDSWVRNVHTKSGLLDEIQHSTVTVQEAETKTLDFLRIYCKKGISPLCGNSVWQDKLFLARYMPSITDFLHYRIIDVTSIKELVKRWYPDDAHAEFLKSNNHRALGDIRESIAELRHYKKYFFV